MDERVDILDPTGRYTGQTALKSVAHRQGLFHPTVHVWCYYPNGKVLLQQRGRDKETHPLLWDVSVAGHVGAGEAIRAAAVREAEEELGLRIKADELEEIGVFKSVQRHRDDLLDCEFHHSFLYVPEVPPESLRLQQSEVEGLKTIPLLQLADEVWGLSRVGQYVPHETSYYKAVIKAIQARL